MILPSRVYLDYNATAPLCEAARIAMVEAMDVGGNASSVHHEGRKARAIVEKARRQLADVLSVEPKQVIFTSSASEAAHHALSPVIRAAGREINVSRCYVGATEHPCVLAGGRFGPAQIETLPVDELGLIDLDALERALIDHDDGQGLAMVAVMLANNETGAVQPIALISELVHRYNGILVVDGVQAFGKMALSPDQLQAHFILLSSHKIGGPLGCGALILGDASISPEPMIKGGGQENYQRAGTENIPAIAGFGAAATRVEQSVAKMEEIAAIRDSLESEIVTICAGAGNKVGEPVFFSSKADLEKAGTGRLPNTTCFAIPGIKAETALIALDLAGVSISSGSACSSGKVNKSHVLTAMGVGDELAACALRVSAGPQTTMKDTERLIGAFRDITSRVA